MAKEKNNRHEFPIIQDDSWKQKSGELPFKMTNDYLFRALMQSDAQTRNSIIASLLGVDVEEITETVVKNPITWEELHMLAAKDKAIERAVSSVNQLIEDEMIREQILQREEYIAMRKRELKIKRQQKEMLAKQQAQITEQQTQITEQQTQITEQQTQITEQRTQITEQQTQITDLQRKIEMLEKELRAKG